MREHVESFRGFQVGLPSRDAHCLIPAGEREEPTGDPRLSNPWEDFEEAYPVAPARTIVITDEVRAKDAADRAAREAIPASSWTTFKLTLGKHNVRPVSGPRRIDAPTKPLNLPAGRSNGRLRSTKVAPSPAQPSPAQPSPAQPQGAKDTMSTQSTVKPCGPETPRNNNGSCSLCYLDHRYQAEREIDALWFSLSAADKRVVLQEAIGE